MKLGIDDRSLDQYTHEQVNCLNVSHRKDIDSRVLGNREVGGVGVGYHNSSSHIATENINTRGSLCTTVKVLYCTLIHSLNTSV